MIEHFNYAIILRKIGFEDDEIKNILDTVKEDYTAMKNMIYGDCKRPGGLAKHSKTTRYLSNYEGEIHDKSLIHLPRQHTNLD